MANALYDKGREAFLGKLIGWDTDTIKAALVDSAAYTVDLAAHQYLADIPSGARILTSAALTGKTITGGVADADDVTFTAATGTSCEALVLYQDTGSAATSRLIAFIDTATAGLPVTPNGGDITVSWSNGASKIFKL